jgi:hypothetical protein
LGRGTTAIGIGRGTTMALEAEEGVGAVVTTEELLV